MNERFPIFEGAEPWSHQGSGDNGRVGVAVVHGFTGNPCGMRPFGEAIAEHGFTVEVPRLPGHGTSWRDMGRTRYSDWKAEFRRVYEDLAKRCDSVFFCGLSMGGTIALDLASEKLEKLRGVVPINATVLDREGLLAKIAPYISYLIPVVPASAAGLVKNDIAKEGEDEKAYGWVPSKSGDSLLRELPRVRQALKQVTVPVLVAYSAHDGSVPNENSKAIADLLGSDDVTVLCLENSKHVATLDLDRELLVEKTADFFRRVSE